MIARSLRHGAVAWLLVVGHAPLAIGQGPGAPGARAAAESFGLGWIDGELTALGAGYRASFSADAFRFVPAFGRAVDVAQPISFALVSIRCGGATLFDAARDGASRGERPQPAPRATALGVAIARGADIVEQYAVSKAGIEQSFRFDRLPDRRGELVVRARVTTPLSCDARGRVAQGLTFRRPGVGAVEYGAVTGIDACGRAVRGWLEWRATAGGGELELGLPAEFVASAELPLLLDPFVGAVFDPTPNAAGSEERPDVASIPGEGYLVVWEQRLSATDADVFAQRVSRDGQLLGGPIAIATGAAEQSHPVAGGGADSRRFVVAWRERSGSSERVLARVVHASGFLEGVHALNPALVPGSDFSLDIGSKLRSLNDTVDQFPVVWSEGGRVRLVWVYVSASSASASFSAIQEVAGGPGDVHPSVSDNTRSWLVVWEHRNVAPSRALGDVWGRRVDPLLAWSAPMALEATGFDETWPRAASRRDGYVVLWQRNESANAASHDVYGKLVDVVGNTLVPAASRIAIATDVDVDSIEPSLATGSPQILATWSNATSFGNAIHTRRIDHATGAPCDLVEVVDTPRVLSDRAPRAALIGADGLIAWSRQALRGGSGDVLARRFAAFGTGAVQNLGGACGITAGISTIGAPAIGNGDFEIWIGGVQVGAAAVLNLGVPGAPLACGSCSLVLPLVSASPVMAGGFGHVAAPIPCDTRLVGVALAAQYLLFPTTGVACPLAPGLSASARLVITIGA